MPTETPHADAPRHETPAAHDAAPVPPAAALPAGMTYLEPSGAASSGAAREESDTRWMIEHYAELVERYPMSWVAIEDRHVVGRGGTRGAALRDALRRMGARDLAEATRQGHDPHLYFLERAADHLLEH